MNSVMTALVTVLAKGNASELESLLNVVGIGRASRAADPAGKFLDRKKMPALPRVEPVIHSSS